MRISGFKFEVAVAVNFDEFKDECESGKGINANAHINLELGEAEVTPDESIEMVHSVMDLIHTEMDKQMRCDDHRNVEKDHHIEDLRKDIDKKDTELKELRCLCEEQRNKISYLSGKLEERKEH